MYRTLVKEGKTELIREYQPVKRLITYRDVDYNYYKPKVFLLQFPTMLFMWNHGRLHVAFTKKPIESLDDIVYCPPMGNIYDDWSVCGCSTGSLTGSIKKFWNSEFTSDGDVGMDALDYTFDSSYSNWKRIKTANGVIRRVKGTPSWLKLEIAFREFIYLGDLYCEEDENGVERIEGGCTLNLKAKYVSKFNDIIPKKTKRRVKCH